MKAINKLRKRRAVSPVIATVVLVAVTITVAVAVAYWMSGIAGQYTAFEKVEIQSGYATLSTAASVKWVMTIELKNTGTATATLITVFINDVPVTQYGMSGIAGLLDDPLTTGTSIPATDGLPIDSGDDATVYVYIGNTYETLSPGTTINIKLHSAGGMDYIKLVQLT